jgi:hypothetical protein
MQHENENRSGDTNVHPLRLPYQLFIPDAGD